MLPEQNWRADAVVRLLISIFICIYAGSLIGSLVHYLRGDVSKPLFVWVAIAGLVSLAVALVLARGRLTRENLVRRSGILLACLYAGLLLGAWASQMARPERTSVLHMVVSALAFQGSTVLLVILFLREQQVSWCQGFGCANKPLVTLLIGVTVGLAFLPLGWILQWISAEVMQHLPWLQLKPIEQQSVQTLRQANTTLHRVVLGVTTVGLAPLAEELLFRGVLYKWIKQVGFPNLAVWGLSLIFAAIHLNALTFAPLFLLSLILIILYERTGNLLAPIAAHASFNATNFGLLYLQSSTF